MAFARAAQGEKEDAVVARMSLRIMERCSNIWHAVSIVADILFSSLLANRTDSATISNFIFLISFLILFCFFRVLRSCTTCKRFYSFYITCDFYFYLRNDDYKCYFYKFTLEFSIINIVSF